MDQVEAVCDAARGQSADEEAQDFWRELHPAGGTAPGLTAVDRGDDHDLLGNLTGPVVMFSDRPVRGRMVRGGLGAKESKEVEPHWGSVEAGEAGPTPCPRPMARSRFSELPAVIPRRPPPVSCREGRRQGPHSGSGTGSGTPREGARTDRSARRGLRCSRPPAAGPLAAVGRRHRQVRTTGPPPKDCGATSLPQQG